VRRLLLPGGVVLAGILLSGCAADGSDAQTTATLQEGVVEIAESAASGDHDSALSSLDALAQDVDDALVAGDIDGGRAVAIRDAIEVVRADLETLAAPEPTPSPETPATNEPVQEVATDPPADEEAPPPAPQAPVTEAPEPETPEPETEAPEPEPETPEPETEAPEPTDPEPEVTEPGNPGNGNGNQGNGNGNNGNGNNGNGNGNQGKGNGKK
jgi:outer membrane biosynthesis protein TonB